MGLLDLLRWLVDCVMDSGPDERTKERAVTLAAAAEDDSVTANVLARSGERTAQPLVAYLEPDEQPEFVLRGGELMISDATGSLAREYPSLETAVVVTEDRVLFVVGGRVSDKVWEVPLPDVVDTHVDEEANHRYFVVEADKEGDRMTFFADITLESDAETIRDCVEFLNARERGQERET